MRWLSVGPVMVLAISLRFAAANVAESQAEAPAHRFEHASLAAYPNAVISTSDPKTGMIFYVESDGRRLVALGRDGTLAWAIDVFKEADVKPAVGKPVVRHLRVDGGSIWATCGKHDSVRIDVRTGRARFMGSD
jgi:hypothetical protein